MLPIRLPSVTLTGVGLQSTAQSFPVWVAPSLVRVGRTDAAGTASSITLSGARGETVDTQVIVQGSRWWLVQCEPQQPPHSPVPAELVSLPPASRYIASYYLTVTGTASYGGGSNPPLGSGTYPRAPHPLQ